MTKGVMIRHLMLPGMWRNTQGVIDFVASNFNPGEIVFCLMRQYIPHGRAGEYPELNSRITDAEYERAVNYMMDSGIEDGFIQEKESADSVYIPPSEGWSLAQASIRTAIRHLHGPEIHYIRLR